MRSLQLCHWWKSLGELTNKMAKLLCLLILADIFILKGNSQSIEKLPLEFAAYSSIYITPESMNDQTLAVLSDQRSQMKSNGALPFTFNCYFVQLQKCQRMCRELLKVPKLHRILLHWFPTLQTPWCKLHLQFRDHPIWEQGHDGHRIDTE